MTTNQNENNLLVRIGILDDKGEPNVIPLAYYFDTTLNKIYINTLQTTKKVHILRKNNVIVHSSP
jgi:nitroimidazol reductase NimA-like FMN-containing flavoprotein (pyridoxamine 5'-phosphate oxidase superfamily)